MATLSDPIGPEGAAELSDLIGTTTMGSRMHRPGRPEPEWQLAAHFQLPLDLRRAMLAREATMSDQAKLKREKRREKNKTRRQKKQQEHQLTDEVREELRASMQETSRLLALPTCPKPP